MALRAPPPAAAGPWLPRRPAPQHTEQAAKRQKLAARPLTPGLSLLESRAVTAGTEQTYLAAFQAFGQYCLDQGLSWVIPSELDSAVAKYLDTPFLAGLDVGTAGTLVLAFKHVFPELREVPQPLPRSSRANRTWNRVSPGGQRLPVPRLLALAIAGYLGMTGLAGMAGYVILVFVCYLRPGEAMRLLGRHLIRPPPRWRGKVTGTGGFFSTMLSWAAQGKPAAGTRRC